MSLPFAPTVVFVTIPERNHFVLLHPLIAGLAAEGVSVHVFAHAQNAAEIERVGATFFDLYGRYSLAEADDESVPLSSRFVTFAARYADEIIEDVAALDPELLVHDVFAVVGRVAGEALDIPRVAVSPWHKLDPAPYIAELQTSPRISIAPRCLEAVRVLQESYGLADASPFCYIGGLSETLNICLEPRAFLSADEQAALEPVAFYGSLPAGGTRASPVGDAGTASFAGDPDRTRVYISFGSIIWRYFTPEALAALHELADLLAERSDVQALISLGQAPVEEHAALLERPNVVVTPWADQWEILREADVFITHHGLASTHEAVFHRVPMLSAPFFGDQPSLAERCAELDLATPVVEQPRGRVSAAPVLAALDELSHGGGGQRRAALELARQWEVETLAARAGVHRRVLELVGHPSPLS